MRGATLLVPAALLACACSPADDGAGERAKVRGDAVLYSLLAYDDERVVLEAPQEAPVTQDLLRPRPSSDYQLPALVVVPPTRVRYELPEPPEGAVLIVAFAVHTASYSGKGSVTFSVTLAGEALLEHRVDCSKAVPQEERVWHEQRVPLERGGALELGAVYEGEGGKVPKVGIGLLRVALPFEVFRQPSGPDRPNVLLVCVDTLRADRLSSHGNPTPVSPRMDALAARGVRFEHAYSSAPWTVPGTASILTGLSCPEHGLGTSRSYYLADTVDTLAEVFQRAGLTTAGFSANPLVARPRNFDQGFEHFRRYRWARGLDVTPDVVAWMREHADERFFLYVHHIDPHGPYEPTDASRERFVPGPKEEAGARDLRDMVARYYEDESVDRDALIASNAVQSALYDAEVWDVDAEIGALLDELESLGIADRTIVCVTADHGEAFLEHGLVGHHEQLFAESVHVPLIFAGPGVPEGEVVTRRVENRYVAPTLIALADVPPAGGVHGPNLVDAADLERVADDGVFLLNSKGTWTDFEARTSRELGPIQSLIDDEWQLIQCLRPKEGEPVVALFDLANDPGCRNDVAAEHPERVKAMQKRIRTWMEEGKAKQPRMVPSTEETEAMLRSLGYVGDEEEY